MNDYNYKKYKKYKSLVKQILKSGGKDSDSFAQQPQKPLYYKEALLKEILNNITKITNTDLISPKEKDDIIKNIDKLNGLLGRNVEKLNFEEHDQKGQLQYDDSDKLYQNNEGLLGLNKIYELDELDLPEHDEGNQLQLDDSDKLKQNNEGLLARNLEDLKLEEHDQKGQLQLYDSDKLN